MGKSMDAKCFAIHYRRTNNWSERMTLEHANSIAASEAGAIVVHVGLP